jgi:hypothetical protein
MKRVLIGLSILFGLLSCRSSQEIPIRIKIDKGLHHTLFDFMPYGVIGEADGDSTADIQYTSNAKIIEINSKYRRLDTCRSYFNKDTLVIELKAVGNFFHDKIVVKIRKKEFWTYLVNERAGISITGKSKLLVVKEKITHKGQEVFGELIVDFPDSKPNLSYVFYGPFRCIVE